MACSANVFNPFFGLSCQCRFTVFLNEPQWCRSATTATTTGPASPRPRTDESPPTPPTPLFWGGGEELEFSVCAPSASSVGCWSGTRCPAFASLCFVAASPSNVHQTGSQCHKPSQCFLRQLCEHDRRFGSTSNADDEIGLINVQSSLQQQADEDIKNVGVSGE